MKTILAFMSALLLVAVSCSAVPCAYDGVLNDTATVQVAEVGGWDGDAIRFEYALPAHGICIAEQVVVYGHPTAPCVEAAKAGNTSWHYPHAYY